MSLSFKYSVQNAGTDKVRTGSKKNENQREWLWWHESEQLENKINDIFIYLEQKITLQLIADDF